MIIEPKVGDKGLVVFASRDISDVVQSKGKAKPASLRKHSMSDGMYIASLLYEEPKRYMEITKDAVSITVPTIGDDGNVDTGQNATNIKVTKDNVNVAVGSGDALSHIIIENNTLIIESKKITLKGDVEITGKASVGKDVTISGDAEIGRISFVGHTHKYDKGITDPPK